MTSILVDLGYFRIEPHIFYQITNDLFPDLIKEERIFFSFYY
jgi:hypothetical protein